MQYTKDVYLKFDPFIGSDRDVEIRNYSWNMVKVRKSHICILSQLIGEESHKIVSGSFALVEKAVVDDEWCSTYSCTDCMDRWLSENFILDDFITT